MESCEIVTYDCNFLQIKNMTEIKSPLEPRKLDSAVQV